MWTSKNRARYDRSKLRYPSDVTDEEWGLIVPLIPPGKSGGGKWTVIMREVVNGLMYVLSTGCQWRAIPKDLPPKSTVYDYFDLWTYGGTLQRIHHALYEQCREQAQREASPTAAIIDSQSVKSAEKDAMGRATRTMAATERPMPQPNDLSRSLVILEQDATLIAVIEMGHSSWLVAGIVRGHCT
jgi:transposase